MPRTCGPRRGACSALAAARRPAGSCELLDLGTLGAIGVRVVGRVEAINGSRIGLRDDLAETVGAAQQKLDRLLARLALTADEEGAPDERITPPLPPFPASPRAIDLCAEGIRTVVWATGFRRNYTWLRSPVLDAEGEIRHEGGLTPAPGLMVLGLRFLRRRNSSFLDGVGADAESLADHMLAHPPHAAIWQPDRKEIGHEASGTLRRSRDRC